MLRKVAAFLIRNHSILVLGAIVLLEPGSIFSC